MMPQQFPKFLTNPPPKIFNPGPYIPTTKLSTLQNPTSIIQDQYPHSNPYYQTNPQPPPICIHIPTQKTSTLNHTFTPLTYHILLYPILYHQTNKPIIQTLTTNHSRTSYHTPPSQTHFHNQCTPLPHQIIRTKK